MNDFAVAQGPLTLRLRNEADEWETGDIINVLLLEAANEIEAALVLVEGRKMLIERLRQERDNAEFRRVAVQEHYDDLRNWAKLLEEDNKKLAEVEEAVRDYLAYPLLAGKRQRLDAALENT